MAIAGGVFLTACGNDEGKKGTTSSLADTSSISSAAEDSSSEAEVKEPKVFECELEAGSEMTAAELAAKLSSDKIDTAAFASGEEKIALDKLGVQSISLNIKLATGEEELWNITVTVVDSEKPKFTGIKEKYEITEGDKLPDFKKGVSVKDNYDESVEFTAELDGKAKKSDYKAGKYTITYKAKDSSGNEVTATSKLIIKKKPEEKKKDKAEITTAITMVATPITTTGATEATVALTTIMAEVAPITAVAPITMEATPIMAVALATIMVEVALIITAVLMTVTFGLGRMKTETGRVARLRMVRHRMEMNTARVLRCGATPSV